MRIALSYILLVTSVLVASSLHGQVVYDVRDAALLALTENTYVDDNGSTIIQDAQDGVSLVDKIEFRSETDRWQTERQEYLLRTSFKSKAEKKAIVGLYGTYLDRWTADEAAERSAAIREVLSRLLKITELQEQDAFLSQRITLQEDKLQLTTYETVTEGSASPLALLKVEDDLLDLQQERAANTKQLTEEKIQLNVDATADWLLETDPWPKPADMLAKVQGSAMDSPMTGKMQAQSAEIRQRQLALQQEVAQGEKVLDFVQLKYTGRDGQGFGNQLAIGVGLVLPTGHLNADAVTEAKVKLHDEQRKELRLKAEVEKDSRSANSSFMIAYQVYEDLQARIERQDIAGRLTRYEATPDAEVHVLLTLKEMVLKQQMDLQESIIEVVESYLKVLYVTGRLTSIESLWDMN